MKKTYDLNFEGEEYEITCDFRLIDMLESEINLILFQTQAANGTVKVGDVAKVIRTSLKRAKVNKSYHDVGDVVSSDWGNYMLEAVKIINACLSKPETPELDRESNNIKKK